MFANIIDVLKEGKLSFLTALTINRKLLYPKTLPVATRPAISEVGRIVTLFFELDLLNHERQFRNVSYLHQIFIEGLYNVTFCLFLFALGNNMGGGGGGVDPKKKIRATQRRAKMFLGLLGGFGGMLPRKILKR